VPPVVALVLLVLFSSVAAGQDAPPAGPASDIHAREMALAEATHARDRARLDELLASDYVLRSSPDIDRETWIRNALSLCWGDRSTIEHFSAIQHEDVVIASFELTFYVDPTDCHPAVMRSLITDVWIRRRDGWRLQIRHSGPAPAASAGVAGQYGIVPQAPPAWDLSGELSLIATGGNTSTRTAGLGATLVHRTDEATTRGSVAFVTSETDAVTQARSVALQARHGVRITRHTELFGQGVYARNRFAGVQNRVTADAGVAFVRPPPQRHTVAVEASIGFTIEERLDHTDLQFATATGAVKYVWRIVPGTEVGEDIAIISDLATARDWRSANTTRITVALTRLLSLKASYVFEHRHAPVAGFGPTDTRTAAALVFSWQRAARVQ
jgi:putative salt-induced outer membrane protein YdiY